MSVFSLPKTGIVIIRTKIFAAQGFKLRNSTEGVAADVSVTFIAVLDLPPRDVSHRRRPVCQKSEDTLEDVSAE